MERTGRGAGRGRGDFHQPVVLAHPLAASGRSGLDLPATRFRWRDRRCSVVSPARCEIICTYPVRQIAGTALLRRPACSILGKHAAEGLAETAIAANGPCLKRWRD